MKTLAIWLVVCAACSGKAEPTHEAAKTHGRYEVVYDIDLDKAVDDKLSQVRAELTDEKISARVSMDGTVMAIPTEPAQRPLVEAYVTADGGSTMTARECGPGALPEAICFGLSPAYAETVKKVALDKAVQTIRERLDGVKTLDAPTVTSRGKQIVVNLPGADEAALRALRGLISRGGHLEFKVVDDDSAFMKRVFAHVGMERSGAPTDPAAVAAGIHADVDQWQPETGERHTDYYLMAADRRALETYVADLARSDPSFRLPDDRTLGYELTEPSKPGDKPMWRSYYLERFAPLTGASIANAELAQDPYTKRPIVMLELNAKGRQAFADLTTRMAGKKLATILDGKIMSAPIVNGPIRGGRASITMGGSDLAGQRQDAEELAQVLRAGSLPAPLAEVSARIIP